MGRVRRVSRREECVERRVSRTVVNLCKSSAFGGVETASKKSSFPAPVGVEAFD